MRGKAGEGGGGGEGGFFAAFSNLCMLVRVRVCGVRKVARAREPRGERLAMSAHKTSFCGVVVACCDVCGVAMGVLWWYEEW